VDDDAAVGRPEPTHVLRLVAEGYTNARIAHELSIAERTVAFHVSNVLGKLDAESRIGAAIWAKDRGIVA
jgi:DNA-binding NarL/FixJ family response regulator